MPVQVSCELSCDGEERHLRMIIRFRGGSNAPHATLLVMRERPREEHPRQALEPVPKSDWEKLEDMERKRGLDRIAILAV
jgi:hypothetical protein